MAFYVSLRQLQAAEGSPREAGAVCPLQLRGGGPTGLQGWGEGR